jgi:ABC-type cobalamin/Fe3+-siderophores transport system ATPase subunit
MLEIQSLTVRLSDRLILDRINLHARSGEVVALIGPNGAGKTTLIRAVSGVLRPEAGRVLVGGEDIASMQPALRAARLAVVPQARNLPEAFTVWETVLMGRTPYLGWLGRPDKQDLERVEWALAQTESLPLRDRWMCQLSGGEQQRVLLARALAQETPILLLDEPTAHLDLRYQASLLGMVQRLAHEQRLTVLAAIHDLNLTPLYTDRVALLSGGRLQAVGNPAEILTSRRLSEVYQAPVNVVAHPEYGTPLVLPDGYKSPGIPAGR